jgi:hypothetical protein
MKNFTGITLAALLMISPFLLQAANDFGIPASLQSYIQPDTLENTKAADPEKYNPDTRKYQNAAEEIEELHKNDSKLLDNILIKRTILEKGKMTSAQAAALQYIERHSSKKGGDFSDIGRINTYLNTLQFLNRKYDNNRDVNGVKSRIEPKINSAVEIAEKQRSSIIRGQKKQMVISDFSHKEIRPQAPLRHQVLKE